MPKNRECIHCINFKTLILNNENSKKYKELVTGTTSKWLVHDGSVRVYFCKNLQLPRPVYLMSGYVEKMVHKDCSQYNIPHDSSPYFFAKFMDDLMEAKGRPLHRRKHHNTNNGK